MGTHPIFESDFDCLTEYINRMSNQTTLQKAIEIVTKATEEDKNGNFEEALKVKRKMRGLEAGINILFDLVVSTRC